MSGVMDEPGKVVMRLPKVTAISQEEYSQKYWPSIGSAVRQILRNPDQINFSQEELCRGIYNVVCQRHGPPLYQDLAQTIAAYLGEMTAYLASMPDNTFLSAILDSWTSYKRSMVVIQDTFRYLEKVYVQEKMGTVLQKEFEVYFRMLVLKPLTHRLADVLPRCPPTDPTVCMALVKQLYDIDKDYAKLNPQLFSMYIPLLVTSSGPEAGIQETNEFFSKWKNEGLGDAGHLKRKFIMN